MKPHYRYLGISRGEGYKDIIFECRTFREELGIRLQTVDICDPDLTLALTRQGLHIYIDTRREYALHLQRIG